MTKKHFIRVAEIVDAIRQGHWTDDSPAWAKPALTGSPIPQYWRAVQTAEAFIHLATEFNPCFDTQRFLVACGLADAPVKASKRKRPLPNFLGQ